ncbi:MAG: radical SAM protein [Opitutaceae bacterium]|jgi:pyruvate formate lyase activating enzyme
MNSARRAVIFDIQRCSLHDGPGIRTAVFIKGCPLRCKWCHNPEALSPRPQWMDGPTPAESGRMVGRETGIEEILELLERDRTYFELSGGGLTLSGGEPMSQFDFTLALLQAAKNARFHTCLDTSGEAPWKRFSETLPFVDLYHYDYKATGRELHHELVGSSGDRIRENLLRLLELGAPVILRCPLVPGINDQDEHLRTIASFAAAHPWMKVDILPYHELARDKRRRLHMPEITLETRTPAASDMQHWRDVLIGGGLPENQLIGSAG